MLSLLFIRHARIAGYRLWFRLDGIPPGFVWEEMRREGWTIHTHTHEDMDGNVQVMPDSVINPDGVTIVRISQGYGDGGLYCLDKKVRREYRRTVDRLIRRHTGYAPE